METTLALAIGVLTGSGVWLLLRPRTFQIIMGLSLLSYAVNLFIFSMGRLGLSTGMEPVLRPGVVQDLAHYADPGLTTIEHHPYANGLELGKVLLRLLGGEDPTEFSLLQPVELVIRASDGPPRKP